MKKTPLRKKAKAHTQGWWMKACDDLMQDINRTLYDKCLVCGGKNEVGHHFITKSLSSYLRYEFYNLIPLCHACHFRHHIRDDPFVSQKIVSIMGGYWLYRIEANRRKPVRLGVTELKDIHERFTQLN